MGETRIGQGRDNAKQFLRDNPDIAKKLEEEIRANAYKLLSPQAIKAARAAGRAPVEEAPTEGKLAGNGIQVDASDFEG